MKYKGKSVEIIGHQRLFDKETLWIHILDTDTFTQVLAEELEDDGVSKNGLAYARFVAIATKIKQEIAEKHILAPYESNLIPLPHQILVLEKVMQGGQTRFMLADEVGMGKTIEAGLVLKEKKLRGEVKRVLLVVPKSAMLQWQSEMKEHFAENFFIYDSDLITNMAKTFASFDAEEELNFWRQHNQIIVSSDALKPIETRQGWSQERVDAYNKYIVWKWSSMPTLIWSSSTRRTRWEARPLPFHASKWQKCSVMQFQIFCYLQLLPIEGRVTTSVVCCN